MTFGEKVRELRLKNGYSQEEVAEKIGISRQAYSKWEKGTTIPDVEKCAALADLYLFGTGLLGRGIPVYTEW